MAAAVEDTAAGGGIIHIIRGVPVSFPFPPYQPQLLYMERVLQALQENTNAILESPTGTGKTLSLLCATLAWRQQIVQKLQGTSVWEEPRGSDERCGLPKIIYASRTHSQLSQAIQELKVTTYRPRVSIVGSRDQLCIHSDVAGKESNAEKVHSCRAKVASKSCRYYNNLDMKKLTINPDTILDIEELIMLGNRTRMCPYYLARELKSEADLIFMPYNYILDVKTRQLHGIDITNTVVILDEAHNIESVCEESASFELSTTDISHCIQDVDHLLKDQYEQAKDNLTELDTPTQNSMRDLMNLKELFLSLEKTLDSIELSPDKNDCVKPGSYIYEYLGTAGVTMATYGTVLDQCGQAISSLTSDQSLHRNGTYLQKFVDAIKIVFTTSCPVGMEREKMASLHYKVYIKSEEPSKKGSIDVWTTSDAAKSDNMRKICFWCFNPGHTMCELARQGVRSVLLTSGTLSPIASFSSELQLDFPITLQGSHVISPDQVWVGVVSKGCDNARLNSSYQNRFTTSYMDSLGNTLVNLCRIIPHGVLVFFPSYVVMETLITHWKNGEIFSRIELCKQVFKEPRKKTDFNFTMNAFYEKLHEPSSKGCAFFAVCRGKVSEGLDFADANGRAVIITGLPYPPRGEPRVQLKLEYLKDAKENPHSKAIGQDEWYSQQATRAVNQAIGRVIRHKNDYGAIILCDERFSYARSIGELPLWLRPQVKKYDKFGLVQKELAKFFKDARLKYDHLASVKGKQPLLTSDDRKVTQQSAVVGRAKGVVKMGGVKGVAKKFKEEEELIDDVMDDYHSAATSNYCSDSKQHHSLLSSLQFSELNPVQPHHLPSAGRGIGVSSRSMFNATPSAPPLAILNKPESSVPQERKKKIIISKRENVSLDHKVVTAQNFVSQLKDHLSNESIGSFKTAIAHYKETDDLDTFLEVLKKLFRNPSSFNLFQGVALFIRPHHRTRYHDAYQSHTGKPHPLSLQGIKRSSSAEQLEDADQPALKHFKFE